jgi:hypothetical protein
VVQAWAYKFPELKDYIWESYDKTKGNRGPDVCGKLTSHGPTLHFKIEVGVAKTLKSKNPRRITQELICEKVSFSPNIKTSNKNPFAKKATIAAIIIAPDALITCHLNSSR